MLYKTYIDNEQGGPNKPLNKGSNEQGSLFECAQLQLSYAFKHGDGYANLDFQVSDKQVTLKKLYKYEKNIYIYIYIKEKIKEKEKRKGEPEQKFIVKK